MGVELPLLMCNALGKMLYTKYVLKKYWLASLVTDGKQFRKQKQKQKRSWGLGSSTVPDMVASGKLCHGGKVKLA